MKKLAVGAAIVGVVVVVNYDLILAAAYGVSEWWSHDQD
jgi:hypothetical protein